MNKPIVVEVSDRYSRYPVDEKSLINAVSMVIDESDYSAAEISLSLVGDEEMQKLNAQFLNHDYPTDVLSFPLSEIGGELVGEIIVSIDTAQTQAKIHQVSADHEIALYVIHGALHLVGYDDKQDDNRVIMREQERYFMDKIGMASASGQNTPDDEIPDDEIPGKEATGKNR